MDGVQEGVRIRVRKFWDHVLWHERTYAAHSLGGGGAWLRGAGHGGDASRCEGGMFLSEHAVTLSTVERTLKGEWA